MIIQLQKKLKTLLNNLSKSARIYFVLIFVLLNVLFVKAQEKKWYQPTRIGFMYGYGNQGGLFLDDKDYSYTSNLFKIQLFYPLRQGKYSIDLEIQPTVGFSKHQLLNFYFIQPNEPDYLAKRAEFTKSKLITEYIMNANLIVSHKITNTVGIYIFLGVGPMSISKRTERLAKGFAFADNIGLGFSKKLISKLNFDFRGSLRHLSNAELKHPNSGINIATIEFGVNFKL